jgi:hypothetical protein
MNYLAPINNDKIIEKFLEQCEFYDHFLSTKLFDIRILEREMCCSIFGF